MVDTPGSKREKPVTPKKVGPLTFVEWVDHCASGDNSWQSIDELRQMTPLLVWSSGWLIEETKLYLVLASSIGQNGAACGDILILKNCIMKRKSLGRAQL